MPEVRKPNNQRGEIAFVFAIAIGLAIGFLIRRVRIGILIGLILGLVIIMTGWLINYRIW